MASSSRSGGARGKKSGPTTRTGRPRGKKAAPAGKSSAVKRGSGPTETGVIAVKRAGLMPRQARAPRVSPHPTAVPDLTAVLETNAGPGPEVPEEDQPYAELEVLAPTKAAAPPQPVAAALPVTELADATEETVLADATEEIPFADITEEIPFADITEEIPFAELAALTAPETPPPEPEEAAPAAPDPAPTGMSWLMAKLRGLSRPRA